MDKGIPLKDPNLRILQLEIEKVSKSFQTVKWFHIT
jgi:hypothetical protein